MFYGAKHKFSEDKIYNISCKHIAQKLCQTTENRSGDDKLIPS